MLPLRRRNFSKEENAALLTGSPAQTHPLIWSAGDEARIPGASGDHARYVLEEEDDDEGHILRVSIGIECTCAVFH